MNELAMDNRPLFRALNQAGITDERVLKVMAATPRTQFVDEAFSHQAWENTALPIGAGQTISQPYIVARMTELVMTVKPKRVLEIGTGSGYQTAVLAQLVEQVYSVERIKTLQWQAKRRLRRLDLHNVATKHGDGWQGWPAKGPFDAIIVTAAAAEVPTPLVEQLVEGGILVIPVGDDQQQLQRITKGETDMNIQFIEAVRFVPLIAGELA